MANATKKAAPAKNAAKGKTETVAAKASKVAAKPDTIKQVKSDTSGNYVVVSTGGESLPIRTAQFKGEVAKLAIIGASFKAVQAFLKTHKPEAKLANGLNGKNAPQSAQAAAESQRPVGKGSQSVANTTDGKNTKTGSTTKSAPAVKASAATKLAKKSGYADSAKITATEKGKAKAAKLPASDRLNQMIKAGTVGAALKIASSADIRYAERTGLLTVK